MQLCELCDQQLMTGAAFVCGLCGSTCCIDCLTRVPAPLICAHPNSLFLRPIGPADGYLCHACAPELLAHPHAAADAIRH